MRLARLARVLAIAASAASAASCRQLLGLDSPSHTGDGGAVDAPLDAPICPTVSTACLDENTLLTCTAPVVGTLTACAWGCDPSGPTVASAHCYQVVPAGGGVVPGDVAPDSMTADVTLTGTVTLDSDTGTIGTLGSTTGFTYNVSGNVAVFRFASLTVEGSLVAIGSHPIALVANGDITIAGAIDATGGCIGRVGGPGGFSGGDRQQAAGGSGGGGFGQMNGGGGGGGYGGSGGSGSNQNAMPAGAGGDVFGDATIMVLSGGGGGGGGQGSGGGGGGGVQLVSNGTITIEASGGINAGGCGGQGNGQPSGGGGGAGGTILLEAPAVTILGALAVNGGGGGGGGPHSASGSAATLDRNPAMGGIAGDAQGGSGGNGAAAAIATGAPGTASNYGGGGGGGIGRIRLNTRRNAGVTVESSAVMSPALDDAASTATQGSAVVQ